MDEEFCRPVRGDVAFSKADPNSWCQMDCLCCPKPGTAGSTAHQEEAGIALFHGRAVATDSADAAADAAADALGKLEVDRAMASYGCFDSSSGLVVATAGRSAPALAALLAAAARGTVRKIIVANCSAGAKMAQALSFGIQEQIEMAAKESGESAAPRHVMSHAGGSTEEHTAWTAALAGRDADASPDARPAGGNGGAGSVVEDGRDWAALQGQLQAGGLEPGGEAEESTTADLPRPAEVCVVGAAEVFAKVNAGEVHVVLVGAESADPASDHALVSANCAEARELALAARRSDSESAGKGSAKVVVVCASWNDTPTNAIVLELEAQDLLVGLPPRPAIS